MQIVRIEKDPVLNYLDRCAHSLTLDLEACKAVEADPRCFKIAENLVDGNWILSERKKNGGRVFCPLTNLKSDYRKFITVKDTGEKLFGCDVANSQLVFMLYLYRDWCAEHQLAVNSRFEEVVMEGRLYETLLEKVQRKPYLEEYMVADINRSRQLDAWKQCYTAWREDKGFQGQDSRALRQRAYKEIGTPAEWEEEKFPHLTAMDRAAIKGEVFHQVLFGKVNEELTPFERLFYDTFPDLLQFVLDMKKSNYRQMSWKLQRAESDWLLERVVPRIMEELPGICIFSVHDSVYSTAENEKRVAQIMEECFRDMGLCTPLIKRERPSNETAPLATTIHAYSSSDSFIIQAT